MPRYDVFVTPAGVLVMDVRVDQLERLGNYVLVPLAPLETAPKPLRGLNPIFDVQGGRHVMMTQLIAAAPRHAFRQSVENLAHYRDEIIRALDVLFTGF